MRRKAVLRSGPPFWLPMTRISLPAPYAIGPIWLPVAEVITICPASVSAWALLTIMSGAAPAFRISSSCVLRYIFKVRRRMKSYFSFSMNSSKIPMSSSVFDLPVCTCEPSGTRANTSALAAAPSSRITTSKFRARSLSASASSVASDAGSTNSTAAITIRLLLTILARATIEGTRLHHQAIPYSVSDVKVKARAANRDQIRTWINLHQTARVIQAKIEERLRATPDLSWAEFELLMRLEVSSDRQLQMSEIAAQLLVSTIGRRRIADRLEKDGLILRETPRENRRIVRAQLTNTGRAVLAEATAAFRIILQETFADHPPASAGS